MPTSEHVTVSRAACTVLLTVVLSFAARPAWAWGVGSAFSEPCHERISGQAFVDYVRDAPLALLPVPNGELWRKVARYVIDFVPHDVGDLDDAQRFLLASLLIGVRAPDTEGHSMLNLQTMRQYHADPSAEGQYAHALRGLEDDGARGDRLAVEGTRSIITDLVLRAEEFGLRSPEDQIIKVPFYLEFYGRVDVEVWGPAYYYGRAVHAIQDTFAHMVRDAADDYHSVVHVMNYIDAIAGDLTADIDGLPHSDFRDLCSGDTNAEMVRVATDATIDFFYAGRARSSGADPEALELFLDRWLTLRDGCTLDNQLCGNEEMLALSRKDATGPYLEGMLGCAASGGTETGPGALALVLALLTGLWLLGRRTSARGGLACVALLATATGGCDDSSAELFRRHKEATQLANQVTTAFAARNGTIDDQRCPLMGGPGPVLVTVRTPVHYSSDGPLRIQLVALSHEIADVSEVSLEVANGEHRIRVPADFDPETGTMELVADWNGARAEEAPEFHLRFLLVDHDGRCGPPLYTPFGPHPGRAEGELLTLRAHRGATTAAHFVERPDVTWLVTGGNDAVIRVWDVETGRPLRELRGHTGAVLSLDSSSDGRYLVSGGQDNTGRVWDLETGELLDTLGYQLGFVHAVAVSHDDRWFALGSWDETVEIRDLQTYELVAKLPCETAVNALAFASSGEYLAIGGGRLFHEGRVQAWSTGDWQRRFDETLAREVTALRFSPTESLLTVGFGRGRVRVWSIAKGELAHEFQSPHPDTITALGFFPAEVSLLGIITLNGFSTIWNVDEGRLVIDAKSQTSLTTAEISRSGDWLVSGDDTGQARIDPMSAFVPWILGSQ